MNGSTRSPKIQNKATHRQTYRADRVPAYRSLSLLHFTNTTQTHTDPASRLKPIQNDDVDMRGAYLEIVENKKKRVNR